MPSLPAGPRDPAASQKEANLNPTDVVPGSGRKWFKNAKKRFCYNCFKAESFVDKSSCDTQSREKVVSNLKTCSKCKIAVFCSRECQVAAHEFHKKACKAAENYDKIDARISRWTGAQCAQFLRALIAQPICAPETGFVLNHLRRIYCH